MLRDLLFWTELLVAAAGAVLISMCGAIWVFIVAGKFLTGERLLYAYTPPALSTETVPVLAIAVVQIWAVAYRYVCRKCLGSAAESLLLTKVTPWVALASMLVLIAWVIMKPAAGASYLPLVSLVLVSCVAAYLGHYGPLSGGPQVVSAPRATVAGETETVARVLRPGRTFADVFGQSEVKRRLQAAAQDVMRRAPVKRAPPRNGILLHGAPGNGKTIFAEALAGELRVPLLTLSYAEVASKWVGEKSARVRQAFEEAERHQPCVLFIDEIDSFLESRECAPGGLKEDRDLVNALLTLTVGIRGSRVLLIAATNHLDRLDAAGTREGRFDFKVEIPPPDRQARVQLLEHALRTHLPHLPISRELIDSVAGRWSGYSVKRIMAVVEELPAYLHRQGRSYPEFRDFMGALKAIQGHGGAPLEDARPLRDLVFVERTRAALDNIRARMADPDRTERLGGTLPAGVIFFGPPGTGKTAACKGLAKELGWSLLATTGAELVRDTRSLEHIHGQACELRPAIIFIDEADDVVRHRVFSSATEATNKLLALMDGVGDRTADVVWIAATNHVEDFDPALLRGGRFTEKVEFELPSAGILARHVSAWLDSRRLLLDFPIEQVLKTIGQTSIPDAEAMLQHSVNIAIGRQELPVRIRPGDLELARRTVLG